MGWQAHSARLPGLLLANKTDKVKDARNEQGFASSPAENSENRLSEKDPGLRIQA
jgi:hypothetical protein